jgi:Ca-activated chloride channel family protein
MRHALVAMLAVTAALANALLPRAADAADWSMLWWRSDQRGQRLLQAGQPALAAAQFSDPRLRAYAELQAGLYAQAAQRLAPFTDARSQYNFGNALAHVGELPAALAAYDAALARAPHDVDARHNRELVAREIAIQPPESSSTSQSAAAAQTGADAGQSASAGSGGSQGSGQQGSAADASASSPTSSSVALAHAGADAGQGLSMPASASPGMPAGRSAAAGKTPANDTDEGLVQAGRSGGRIPSRPDSGQTLLIEQWLQRIPDDPGGMLRRKFLIEHLLREPASGGGQGGGP